MTKHGIWKCGDPWINERPYDWNCRTVAEILSHAEGALNLDRLKSIGVVLYNHNRDAVIGKITKAWVENERGMAEIEFDDDESSEVIRKKVASGTLKGVSVGYRVDCWEEVKPNATSSDGKHEGPCSIATKWTPFEVSIVSVPADPTVGVGRSQEDSQEETHTPDKFGEENKGASGLYFAKRRLLINQNALSI